MIVLDTHAWLWWTDMPKRLSPAAQQAIDASPELGVSPVSCWELAMLAVTRRLELAGGVESWIRRSLANPRVVALPLHPDVAVAAALLTQEGFVGDPADRIIYATAREAGARLVTKDESIRGFDPARTVW